MRKLVLFMHTSLDGFVAGPKGEMDWITVNDKIFAYVANHIEKCDTAMYGRVTYEMMEAYWPTAANRPGATKHDIEHSQWYAKVNKVVLSRSMKGQQRPLTRIISDNLREEIQTLKQQPGSDILIFGSPGASHALMELGLIDGYWLFVNPVLIGKGIPLFSNIHEKTKLKLLESTVIDSGVNCLTYERDAPVR